MEKIFCGRRIREAENHWQEVDIDSYKITKPTFLLFGGNLTTHPEQANSYAKTIYKLLDKYNLDANGIHIFEDFDCLSFYYKQNLLMCTYNRLSGQMLNDNIINEVEELYNKLVSPLVEEEITLAKSGQTQGFHPLSNLILFAHSAGAQVALRLQEIMYEKLTQELDEQTTLKILKNVKYYGFASYVKVGDFDQTYIVGTKDFTMMEYYPAISFSVETMGDKNAFNYYSCTSPLFEREKHQVIVSADDIVDLDKIDAQLLYDKFENLVTKLKGKIVLEPREKWAETIIDETTYEIRSVKYASLDNDGEKVILANMGHSLVSIVGDTTETRESNTDNSIEDMFVHNKLKHAFVRERLDMQNLRNLAYITLSDDMTETLKHKCELNKATTATVVAEDVKTNTI